MSELTPMVIADPNDLCWRCERRNSSSNSVILCEECLREALAVISPEAPNDAHLAAQYASAQAARIEKLEAAVRQAEAQRDKLVEAANAIFDRNDDYDADRLLVDQDDVENLYNAIPEAMRTADVAGGKTDGEGIRRSFLEYLDDDCE